MRAPIVVSNADLHHFHAVQIYAICDKPIDVATPWGKLSSKIVGRELARYAMRSAIGQVRQNLLDNYWTVLTEALKGPLPAKALSFGA